MLAHAKVTVEELLFEFKGRKLSADADLTASFHLHPPEPQTRNYPGCPATAEFDGYEIERLQIYNEQGDEIDLPAAEPLVVCKVEEWINSNDEYLQEQAVEAAAEAEAAAMDARYGV